MISRDYCILMAKYNCWQNMQLEVVLDAMPKEELTRERGAFFGSILATVNHLYWGDLMWMSRFEKTAPPAGGIKGSVDLFPTLASWSAERFRLDGRIRLWAEKLNNVDLAGNLSWYSGAAGRDVVKPMGLVVAHMFNHQTHHRGQVHAMITAAGAEAPVSDLFLMPETI